jgi:hypothetical protein
MNHNCILITQVCYLVYAAWCWYLIPSLMTPYVIFKETQPQNAAFYHPIPSLCLIIVSIGLLTHPYYPTTWATIQVLNSQLSYQDCWICTSVDLSAHPYPSWSIRLVQIQYHLPFQCTAANPSINFNMKNQIFFLFNKSLFITGPLLSELNLNQQLLCVKSLPIPTLYHF